MIFELSEEPVSAIAIKAVEDRLGIKLPKPVFDLYLRANGGGPNPYVFENDELDTVVSALLPIVSAGGERSCADVYEHLAIGKRLLPKKYLPFAEDGGGDYFFVDCESPDGNVFFYRGDCGLGDPLLPLHLTFDAFWNALKPE